jgi:hypothetical protein
MAWEHFGNRDTPLLLSLSLPLPLWQWFGRREFETRQDPATRKLSYGGELPESQHAAKLRRLVVDLAAPRYTARDPTQPDPTPPGMNSEQYEAVQRVLGAQDYTLVLGMPGAGKTTTIVSMVQVRQAAGGGAAV